MRKLILGLILLSFSFAANAQIRETMTNARIYRGYEFLTMAVTAEAAPTTSALVWYVDNLMGYSSIAVDGFDVTAGSVPTTISAQAVYPNGTNVSVDAQIVTVGTDLTLFHSPWYKFTLDADSVTRDVSFIFNVAD